MFECAGSRKSHLHHAHEQHMHCLGRPMQAGAYEQPASGRSSWHSARDSFRDAADVKAICESLETAVQVEAPPLSGRAHRKNSLRTKQGLGISRTHSLTSFSELDLRDTPSLRMLREGTGTLELGPAKENLSTADAITLSELSVLTGALKDQIFFLQGEAKEQRDKFELLQKEVSDLTLEKVARDALAMVKSEVVAGAEETDAVFSPPPKTGLLTSPRKRLSQATQALKSCISPARSRSASPRKGLRPEFKDVDEIQPFVSNTRSTPQHFSIIDSPARSISPSKSRSPTRRIEARLGKKLIDNMSNLVDAQVQNLELRMAEMEASFSNWRQAAVPDGAVKGMTSSDLQMLSGLTVVESRPDDFRMLLDPTDGAWDYSQPTSCQMPGENIEASKTTEPGKRPKKELAQKKTSRWKFWIRKSNKPTVNHAICNDMPVDLKF